MGRHFHKLAATVQRVIHELFTPSANNLLEHGFESGGVKALHGTRRRSNRPGQCHCRERRTESAYLKLLAGSKDTRGISPEPIVAMLIPCDTP